MSCKHCLTSNNVVMGTGPTKDDETDASGHGLRHFVMAMYSEAQCCAGIVQNQHQIHDLVKLRQLMFCSTTVPWES